MTKLSRLLLPLLLLRDPLAASPLKPEVVATAFNPSLPTTDQGEGRTEYSSGGDREKGRVVPAETPSGPPPAKSGPSDPAPSAPPNAAPAERLNRAGWTIKYFDSEETRLEKATAAKVLDGSKYTFWHTCWSAASNPGYPHEIQIDMKAVRSVSGFVYLPRQDGVSNGRIAGYQIYLGTDGTAWDEPVATGKWTDTGEEKIVTFPATPGRYVRLVALSEVNGQIWASAAELNILGSEK